MRYERQMGMQAAPVVELASRVRRLQTTGAWPAHAAPSSPAAHSAALFADADDEEQEDAMSMAVMGSYQGLSARPKATRPPRPSRWRRSTWPPRSLCSETAGPP